MSETNFNIPKTVVIPVDIKEFRERVILTRKLNEGCDYISDGIKILSEGETTRLLGAFVGNGIDDPSIWMPTIEKIINDLERWKRAKSTMEEKRLIIGMVVGGQTQFKTHIQGMPKQVEEKINKLIQDFIWGKGTYLTIEMPTLTLLHERGGKKVLDSNVRNKAIERS